MNELIHTVSRESQEEPVSDAANPEQSDPSSSTKTVLLAEDEPVVREFMASVIRDVGYNVLQAENGEHALRLFEGSDGQSIDLLVTDIVMPVMGGKELAYRVGSRFPTTKIVFSSAYPEKLGVSNGMFDKQIPFLQKPVSVDALKLKVREVLGDAEEDLQQSSADKSVLCSTYPEKLNVSNEMFDKQIPFLQKPATVDALELEAREVLGDAEEDLQQGSADIGALPQQRFEEPHWASLWVVLLVVAADVFTVVILLLAILHWLK